MRGQRGLVLFLAVGGGGGGVIYKAEFTEYSQLAWKVGETCSTKRMMEM